MSTFDRLDPTPLDPLAVDPEERRRRFVLWRASAVTAAVLLLGAAYSAAFQDVLVLYRPTPQVHILFPELAKLARPDGEFAHSVFKIYAEGKSRQAVENAVMELQLPVEYVNNRVLADIILGSSENARRDEFGTMAFVERGKLRVQFANENDIPAFLINATGWNGANGPYVGQPSPYRAPNSSFNGGAGGGGGGGGSPTSGRPGSNNGSGSGNMNNGDPRGPAGNGNAGDEQLGGSGSLGPPPENKYKPPKETTTAPPPGGAALASGFHLGEQVIPPSKPGPDPHISPAAMQAAARALDERTRALHTPLPEGMPLVPPSGELPQTRVIPSVTMLSAGLTQKLDMQVRAPDGRWYSLGHEPGVRFRLLDPGTSLVPHARTANLFCLPATAPASDAGKRVVIEGSYLTPEGRKVTAQALVVLQTHG